MRGAGRVEKDNGEGGGSGGCEKLEARKVVGVPNGEGRSGSMRRFTLRDVRNAALVRNPGMAGITGITGIALSSDEER